MGFRGPFPRAAPGGGRPPPGGLCRGARPPPAGAAAGLGSRSEGPALVDAPRPGARETAHKAFPPKARAAPSPPNKNNPPRRWSPRLARAAPRKKAAHTAMSDIKESLEELRYYKEKLFRGHK